MPSLEKILRGLIVVLKRLSCFKGGKKDRAVWKECGHSRERSSRRGLHLIFQETTAAQFLITNWNFHSSKRNVSTTECEKSCKNSIMLADTLFLLYIAVAW